jgi:hypothetical protein
VYIPEGVKVSLPAMEEVKVPEGGDVGSEEDATAMPNPQWLHHVCSPWDRLQSQVNVNAEQKLSDK